MQSKQHRSGKDFDPSEWARQRRAAVEAANQLRVERKTSSSEAASCSFSPDLIARKSNISPGAPLETDQKTFSKFPSQNSRHPSNLEELASDSLDHFYVNEG